MRLIDVDVFREEYGLAKRCEDCPRYGKKDCDYPYYSAKDFCGWLDDAPTVGDWVSIKDRLPKDGQDILVYLHNGEETRIAPCNYDKGAWYDCVMNCAVAISNITHWMPLPEPPKEVKNEID